MERDGKHPHKHSEVIPPQTVQISFRMLLITNLSNGDQHI